MEPTILEARAVHRMCLTREALQQNLPSTHTMMFLSVDVLASLKRRGVSR